ncbi:MAG: PAS domain S-box protein [bacterium]|nr:PAS domain S-box protein [bacterium]
MTSLTEQDRIDFLNHLETYRSIFDHAPFGIYHTTLSGKLLTANTAFAEMLGYSSPEECLQQIKNASDDLFESNIHREAMVHSLLSRGISEKFEANLKTKDGSLINVMIRSLIVRDSKGSIRYVENFVENVTARKQAEKFAQTKQEILDKLIDNVNAVFWEFAPETYQFTFISSQIEKILGIPSEVFLQDATKWIDHVVPEDQEIASHKFFFFQENETELTLQYRMQKPNGDLVWILDKISAKFENGLATQLYGVLLDITESKRTEQLHKVLYEISKCFSETSSLNELLTVVHQQLNTLVDASHFYVALYHVSQDKYSFPYYVDPDDEPVSSYELYSLPKSLTDYVRRTGKPLLCTSDVFHRLLANGEVTLIGAPSECWLGVPLISHNEVIGIVALQTYKPNTTYGQFEVELMTMLASQIAGAIERKIIQEERTSLLTIIEAAEEHIVLLDTYGKILNFNPAFSRATGYTLNEAIFHTTNALLQVDEYTTDSINEAIRNGLRWDGIRKIFTKNNEPRFLQTSISPVRDEQGEIINFLEISRDISREQALAEQLRQTHKLEALGQIASGIVHDINNILTGIIGYLELAKNSQEETSKNYLNEAWKAAQRATELTKNILRHSRRTPLSIQPVNVNILLDEIYQLIRSIIDKRIGLELQTENLSYQVLADSNQLHQVLINLCVNARDAIKELPIEVMKSRDVKIIIQASDFIVNENNVFQHPNAHIGKYVRFSVIDNGIGIPPDIQSKIFEPFFTTKKGDSGTGLGLASVRAIITEHKGWIEVCSEEGKGSEFTFYLPAALKTIPNLEVSSYKPSKLATGNETILVVDDEEMIRSLAQTILEQLGYKVILAKDGREGLTKFIENRDQIALVILDYSMPILTGGEVLQQILAVAPKTKVAISSGYALTSDDKVPDFRGAVGFIAKPYNIMELSHTIRRLIDMPIE